MKYLIKTFIVVISLSQLIACASIVSSKSTTLNINSTPPGAKVEITDKRGAQAFVGQTPAIATLNNGDGYFTRAHYTINISKDGYAPFNSNIDSSMNGWYWGNIIFGGLVGMLVVDPLTGAMFEIDQPPLNPTLAEIKPSATDPTSKPENNIISNLNERIQTLEKLKVDGMLTEKEFQEKKKEILNEL